MQAIHLTLHQILCSIEQEGIVTSSYFIDSTKEVSDIKVLLDEMLEVMAYHILNKNDVSINQTIAFKLSDGEDVTSKDFIQSSIIGIHEALIITVGMIRSHAYKMPFLRLKIPYTVETLDKIIKQDREYIREIVFNLSFASEEEIKTLSTKLAKEITAGVAVY